MESFRAHVKRSLPFRNITAPQGSSIASVTFKTPTQSGQLTLDTTSGLYTGSWNIWREGEGLKTLAITATDSTGATATVQRSVLIQDSQLKVHITSPTFDQVLTGLVTVSAQVQPDPRFPLRSVTLKVGSISLPMTASASSPSTYTVQLASSRLPNTVYTVNLLARDTQFVVSDLADVQIENNLQPEHIVRTAGTVFTDGNRLFRYVGWNEYDLFTRNDETLDHDEQTEMVTAGAEAHGAIPAGDGVQGFQWGGSNDPLFTQNVPDVDFFTFHPYPNTSWIMLTLQQTKQLIKAITKEGTQIGKPVVMEEYGIDRNQPLYNPDGTVLLQPTDPGFLAARVTWYRDMLDTLYDAGAAGSNVWQLADWSDNDYNLNSYLPQAGVERGAPVMAVLSATAKQIDQGNNNSWWW